jgi:hypothetical protein
MTREEHSAIIAELMKSPDQAKASELLAKLSTDYGTTLGQVEQTTKEMETLKQYNSRLVEANSNLFLQVTQSHKEDNPDGGNTNHANKDDPKTPDVLETVKGLLNKK